MVPGAQFGPEGTKAMETESRQGRLPAREGSEARPGQSGEGARSAMEQLIRQEQRRDAQRPREGAEAEPATVPRA